MLDNYPDVLTASDICEILHTFPYWVYTYIRSGQIKSIRIGRLIRVNKLSLIEYITRQEETKSTDAGKQIAS